MAWLALADLVSETHETVVLGVLAGEEKTIKALKKFGGGRG